ncbi:unnamed protein product, partial [Allacma fusca]
GECVSRDFHARLWLRIWRAFGGRYCLDAQMDTKDSNKPVILYPCHKQGGNQVFSFTEQYEIRRESMCVDFPGDKVITFGCHGAKGNQLWNYDAKTKQLLHVITQKCMTAEF